MYYAVPEQVAIHNHALLALSRFSTAALLLADIDEFFVPQVWTGLTRNDTLHICVEFLSVFIACRNMPDVLTPSPPLPLPHPPSQPSKTCSPSSSPTRSPPSPPHAHSPLSPHLQPPISSFQDLLTSASCLREAAEEGGGGRDPEGGFTPEERGEEGQATAMRSAEVGRATRGADDGVPPLVGGAGESPGPPPTWGAITLERFNYRSSVAQRRPPHHSTLDQQQQRAPHNSTHSSHQQLQHRHERVSQASAIPSSLPEATLWLVRSRSVFVTCMAM